MTPGAAKAGRELSAPGAGLLVGIPSFPEWFLHLHVEPGDGHPILVATVGREAASAVTYSVWNLPGAEGAWCRPDEGFSPGQDGTEEPDLGLEDPVLKEEVLALLRDPASIMLLLEVMTS